jgi:hypothetical protein
MLDEVGGQPLQSRIMAMCAWMTTNDRGDERAVETPRSPPRERNIATSTEVERRYYIVGHVSECAVHIQLGIKFQISRWQHYTGGR